MTVHSPTWIYVGTDPNLINPDWNSSNASAAGTSQQEAESVVGWDFPSNAMQGVTVTGNATQYGGANFARGVDVLSYSVENSSGGSTSSSGVYTSHIVVDTVVDVLRADGAGGTVAEQENLRAVIVQMENGDLFMRPFYSDVGKWNDMLADSTITNIKIDDLARNLNPPTSNTDSYTNGMSGSATYNPALFDDDTFAPCFLAGTFILTPRGRVRVEDLRVGDMVCTLDHAYQRISWIGRRVLTPTQLEQAPQMTPILIARNALGANMPCADLRVSPQHRVLVRSAVAQELFGEREVLVAAKHLVGMPGITIARESNAPQYYHLMFARHEIIDANGAWSESFYPGKEAMKGTNFDDYHRIMTIAPKLRYSTHSLPPARRFCSGKEAQMLCRAIQKTTSARSWSCAPGALFETTQKASVANAQV